MPQYTRNPPLDVASIDPDPLRQFETWMSEAQAADLVEPTAMALATASPDGRPSVRMVLFKGLWQGSLTFYTHRNSPKGCDLELNPFVAATFWWDRLERQLRIEGRVAKLPQAMADAYFYQRPRESQLASYTSRQSQLVSSREAFEARLAENERRFEGRDVPFPPHWGGYAIEPERFEFWQGRLGRAHDRLAYRRNLSDWTLERLEP